jgi:dTDP-4-dehydrorhamnose reductase
VRHAQAQPLGGSQQGFSGLQRCGLHQWMENDGGGRVHAGANANVILRTVPVVIWGEPVGHSLLVLGAGYVGHRLQVRAAASGRYEAVHGFRSRDWNLDSDAPPPTIEGTRVAYLVPPPPAGETDPRLTRAMAALLCPQHRVERFVYVSTTGVYGDTEGGVVDEDTPPRPLTARARRRWSAEQSVRDTCMQRNIEWTILRVPGIYGPGRLPLERLQRGEPLPRSAETRPGNRIHVDDLVLALELALLHPSAANSIFNVGDGDATSQPAFQRRLAELAGLPPPVLVADEEARSRLSPEAWSFLAESRRVETQRIRERLGFVPRHADCREGLRASLTATEAAAD